MPAIEEEVYPEPSPFEVELERIIVAMIERKDAAQPGSAEYRMAIRQLCGIRYRYEEAGGIIEDLDPDEWGSYCRPP